MQLYVVSQFDQKGFLYNEPLLVDLRGTIDLPRLQAALLEVAVQQEGLRCWYTQGPDGLAIAATDRLDAVPLRVADLRGKVPVDADEHAPLVHEQLKVNTQMPFDLTGGQPLWRVLVVRVADARAMVLFTLHHAIMDGW